MFKSEKLWNELYLPRFKYSNINKCITNLICLVLSITISYEYRMYLYFCHWWTLSTLCVSCETKLLSIILSSSSTSCNTKSNPMKAYKSLSWTYVNQSELYNRTFKSEICNRLELATCYDWKKLINDRFILKRFIIV